jgi:hypothetical protein
VLIFRWIGIFPRLGRLKTGNSNSRTKTRRYDSPRDFFSDFQKLAKWEKQLVKYTHEVEFEVQESWTLTWEFTTKDYDIG